MARLVNESGILGENLIDLTDTKGIGKALQEVGFAKITEAIHIIQEDMGIMGTTTAEASGTISGSTAAMKAAWQNLLVGISDDTQDFDGLIDNLVNSVSTVADNVLPRIEIIFGGLGQLVEQLFPKIVEQIPKLVSEGLPKLVTLATTLLKTLVDGLKKNSKLLASGGVEIIRTLINGIADMLPDFVELGLDLIIALAEGIADNIGTVTDTIADVILRIVNIFTNPDTLTRFINSGVDILLALVDGLTQALPQLTKAIPSIIATLIKAVPDIIDGVIKALLDPQMIDRIVQTGIEIFEALVDDLPTIIDAVIEAVPKIIDSLCNHFLSVEFLNQMLDTGDKLIGSLLENFPDIVETALSVVDKIFGTHIAEWYREVSDFFMDFGSQLYRMTHEDLLAEEELSSKYSMLDTELNNAALAAIQKGLTVEQAFDEAKRTVLDTAEELYAFEVLSNSDKFRIGFSLDRVKEISEWNEMATIPSQNSAQYYEAMGRERLAQAQPLVVTLQMPSGVEVGRQYIEDINTAKRVDGVAY